MWMGRHLEKKAGESLYTSGFCFHLPCTGILVVALVWSDSKKKFGGEMSLHFHTRVLVQVSWGHHGKWEAWFAFSKPVMDDFRAVNDCFPFTEEMGALCVKVR